jgi:hypothetical protein
MVESSKSLQRIALLMGFIHHLVSLWNWRTDEQLFGTEFLAEESLAINENSHRP